MSNKNSITITARKKGRFISGSSVGDVCAPNLVMAALVIEGGIKAASPVLTGTLRRSWTTGQAQKQGNRVVVKVGSAVVYARRVNLTSKANKGYVQAGIAERKAKAIQVFKDGLKANAGLLWQGD